MDEYIEREKAKRLLHIEYAYAAEQLLDEIPAADVAPVVHARWDDSGRYTFPGGSTAVSCTNCECKLTVSEFRLNKWNYCPNCGAKMERSELSDNN